MSCIRVVYGTDRSITLATMDDRKCGPGSPCPLQVIYLTACGATLVALFPQLHKSSKNH